MTTEARGWPVPLQQRATECGGIGHVVSVADEELHLAILTAIKVAEEPERSLVSVTDLAEVVESRLHVSARELTAAVDVLYRAVAMRLTSCGIRPEKYPAKDRCA